MIALIVEATLRSTVLVAVIWLILKCVRLRDLRVEKLIWTVVVLTSLAMPALLRNVTLPLPSQTYPILIAGRLETLAAIHPHTLSNAQILWALYCMVTVMLLARFGRGMWIAGQICHRARRVSIDWAPSLDVRASHQVRAPSSFGSIILLPAEWHVWDATKLRAVIGHESAHIRDFDHYRLWLASLYCALYWFSPGAIWLRRRLSILAELISDEAAVAAVGDRAGYADLLMNLAAGQQPPAATLAMAAPSTLMPRLTRLLETDMSIGKIGRTFKVTLLTMVTAVAATTTFADGAPLVLTEAQDPLVSWESGNSLSSYYPAALRKQHVEGSVTCRLTINAAGDVIDAVAVKETPVDSGLALAAIEATKTFHFKNTLSRPVVKVLSVKFALTGT